MYYLYISEHNNHNEHDVVQHTAMGPFQTSISARTAPPYALCVKSVSVKVLTGMEHAAKGRRQRENESITGGDQDSKEEIIGQKEERQ
jgi:DNA-binding NtrC family response regulator